MKKSIITIVTFMLFALAGFAQEKYDFIIVSSDFGGVHISSIKGEEHIKLAKEDNLMVVLLKKVDELQNEGWEVYTSSALGDNRFLQNYYLRKKKQ